MDPILFRDVSACWKKRQSSSCTVAVGNMSRRQAGGTNMAARFAALTRVPGAVAVPAVCG
jgi:hypothetical protein